MVRFGRFLHSKSSLLWPSHRVRRYNRLRYRSNFDPLQLHHELCLSHAVHLLPSDGRSVESSRWRRQEYGSRSLGYGRISIDHRSIVSDEAPIGSLSADGNHAIGLDWWSNQSSLPLQRSVALTVPSTVIYSGATHALYSALITYHANCSDWNISLRGHLQCCWTYLSHRFHMRTKLLPSFSSLLISSILMNIMKEFRINRMIYVNSSLQTSRSYWTSLQFMWKLAKINHGWRTQWIACPRVSSFDVSSLGGVIEETSLCQWDISCHSSDDYPEISEINYPFSNESNSLRLSLRFFSRDSCSFVEITRMREYFWVSHSLSQVFPLTEIASLKRVRVSEYLFLTCPRIDVWDSQRPPSASYPSLHNLQFQLIISFSLFPPFSLSFVRNSPCVRTTKLWMDNSEGGRGRERGRSLSSSSSPSSSLRSLTARQGGKTGRALSHLISWVGKRGRGRD